MTELVGAAVQYALGRMSVFPLRPREKKPYGRTIGFKMAASEPDQVEAWWAGREPLPLKPETEVADRRPVFASMKANVGIATGAVSGFWVLDLDGPAAEAGLAALEAAHGALPVTVEQTTGKGRQLLFAWDPARVVRNSAGKVGDKIDVRGDGGYIVAPPSIHPGDPAAGVPPGRVYAWTPGRAPSDMPIAAAPGWLLDLVAPIAPAAAPRPAAPAPADGRASKLGEACLRTAARMISTAPSGRQQASLWGYACFIGSYVAGGEIEQGYARDTLIDAGLAMTPAGKPWLRKDIESHVERGLAKGALHPRTGEQRQFVPGTRAERRAAPSPVAAAEAVSEVRQLWDSARPADCGAFRMWLKMRGLDHKALPRAMERLRAHQHAPIGGGRVGPALLAPMARAPEDAPAALAVLPLFDQAERFRTFVGDPEGLVVLLTDWPEPCELLVAVDLQDAWALGSNAQENEHDLGLVIAPRLRTFAGGMLGDRWGRVNPETPLADPSTPPWTTDRASAVYLAVRNDLVTPEMRRRQALGGTARFQLTGREAATFYAGLAEQSWRAALDPEATVTILRPNGGAGGFNTNRGRA